MFSLVYKLGALEQTWWLDSNTKFITNKTKILLAIHIEYMTVVKSYMKKEINLKKNM